MLTTLPGQSVVLSVQSVGAALVLYIMTADIVIEVTHCSTFTFSLLAKNRMKTRDTVSKPLNDFSENYLTCIYPLRVVQCPTAPVVVQCYCGM